MKRFLTTLSLVLSIGLPSSALATTAVPWLQTNLTDVFFTPGKVNGINLGIQVLGASSTLQNLTFRSATGTSATTTNFFSSFASTTNLRANIANIGNLTVGSCTGCSTGGFAFPFTTLSTGENATSTTLAFLNGFLSTASSTINSTLLVIGSSTLQTTSITALRNLTTNGFVKTSGGTGLLSVDTTNYSTFAFPFKTLGTGENSTSTTLAFFNGFISTASSTLSTILALGSTTLQTFSATNGLINGKLGIGTTTPEQGLTVASSSAILAQENVVATSTSQTIDWSTGNNFDVRIGTSAVTFAFTNYYSGQHALIEVCNPDAGTPGAITWPSVVHWAGQTAPTKTATTGACDLWSFYATQATSTSFTAVKIFGAQTANFQ